MTKDAFVLAIDQGTTGSRAILYNQNAGLVTSAYEEFPQIFPKPGWVEQDAEKIWQSVLSVVGKVLKKSEAAQRIAALGITNQRETTVLWDRRTGRPVHSAIVWQDRRTALDCERFRACGYEKQVRAKTGLVLDPYFSATKIAWLLKHIPGLRKKALKGEILFGTIDTWLLWKLTGAQVHATDPTNASRTLLYNIHSRKWDNTLLKMFNIPGLILPQVRESGGYFGVTAAQKNIPKGIPIRAVMGDQQAALYGHSCYRKGQVKNTYGTGCFAVLNLGATRPSKIPEGLLETLACDEKGKSVYALEGSVFIGGAVIQWIRDGLKLITHASQTEAIAQKVKDTGGVTFIPAFSGMGSPYWNPHARGMISGITRGTTAHHIIRAAVESIAQQSADVIMQMRNAGVRIRELKVDGGATKNNFLMQFQADLLQIPILVSSQSESTAWGVVKLAAKSLGLWKTLRKVQISGNYRKFYPQLNFKEARLLRQSWKKEILRVLL